MREQKSVHEALQIMRDRVLSQSFAGAEKQRKARKREELKYSYPKK